MSGQTARVTVLKRTVATVLFSIVTGLYWQVSVRPGRPDIRFEFDETQPS